MSPSTPIPNYVSELSITFDEERGLYIGEFYSGGYLHRVEGADRASVTYLMEGIVSDQYKEMVRSTNYWKERAAAKAEAMAQNRGRGGSSSGNDGPKRMDGILVKTYTAGDKNIPRHVGLGSAFKWSEMMMSAIAIAHGNYGDLAYTAAGTLLGDWYEGVESIWNKQPKKKIFAVSFGGILITATSRSMLRKLLTRQRNIRIQRIMNSIRIQKKDEEDAEGARTRAGDRLRAKKRRAEILRPRSWERKISPQGDETGWRGKTLNLKERLKDKKGRAKDLWTHRMIG